MFIEAMGADERRLAGFLLQATGSVTPMFFICAAGYPLAWLALRFPRPSPTLPTAGTRQVISA
jgi:hypothetical protein